MIKSKDKIIKYNEDSVFLNRKSIIYMEEDIFI